MLIKLFLHKLIHFRSSYKLIEINQKHKILSHGHVVLDIGCAPGSWSQVCVNAVNSDNSSPNKPKGLVIGVDKLQIYPLESLIFFGNSDFTAIETQRKIMTALNGRKVNCVLSDMAPNATGVKSMDQHNIMDLANAVFNFAKIVSTANSSLVVKVWSNGDLNKFVETLKQSYEVVKYVKPEASRGDSAEIFIVAKNYKAVIA